MPHEGESIMISKFPEYKEELNFAEEEKQTQMIMSAVVAIRNRRAEMNVHPSKKAQVIIVTDKADIFSKGVSYFEKLASAQNVEITDTKSGIDANAVNIVVDGAEIFMPLGELVDKDKELERLNKEKTKLEGEIKRVEGKLNNQGFVAKAPQKVIDEEKEKGVKYKEMLEKVLKSIDDMNKLK